MILTSAISSHPFTFSISSDPLNLTNVNPNAPIIFNYSLLLQNFQDQIGNYRMRVVSSLGTGFVYYNNSNHAQRAFFNVVNANSQINKHYNSIFHT